MEEKEILEENDIEYEKCSICDEFFEKDSLIETEGLVNGGVGKVCEQCLEDNDIE